jgi:hypothetical protein
MTQENEAINQAKGFQSRQDSMDAILAKRHEELKKEVEDGGGTLLEEEADEKETDGEDEKAEESLDAKSEDDGLDDLDNKKADDEQEQTVELLIDGQKTIVSMSKALEMAQKSGAADRRLQEAELKRREADELLQRAKATPPADDQDLEDDKDLVNEDEDLAEKRKAYIHAMNYGEPEEQEEAMKEYEAALKGISLSRAENSEDLAAKIKAEIKEELTGDQIRERFNLPEDQGGFGDIMADEDLREFTYLQIDKAIESGADPTKWETYADAAGKVRDRFIAKKASNKKQPSDSFKEKRLRKRKVDNLETISDRKDTDLENQNPESSKGLRGSIIADMARSRPGQHNY